MPAQRVPILVDGIFQNFLTSRETAPVVGQTSNGTSRADGWSHLPLIRMTNISLEPREGSLAEIIGDTKDGIFMATNQSWSIDDKRINFQFGCEIAWRIQNGKLTQMYKNPNYTGITPEFWGSCDAVGGREEWTVWGTPNCGKGQPGQVGARRARHVAGAVPQRPGGGALMPGLDRRGPVPARSRTAALELPGVDGVEVLFMHEWGGLTRFANSVIHQCTFREDTGLRVRVVSRNRTGVASSNDFTRARGAARRPRARRRWPRSPRPTRSSPASPRRPTSPRSIGSSTRPPPTRHRRRAPRRSRG